MKEKKQNIRIESLSIRNYRGIDKLDLSFDLPQMSDDADITVIGSKNGVGKTSVLEACAWAVCSSTRHSLSVSSLDLPIESLIKAGSQKSDIYGNISLDKKKRSVGINIHSSGVFLSGIYETIESDWVKFNDPENLLNTILADTSNPLFLEKCMFFHSYRKVREGNVELSNLINNKESKKKSNGESASNLFKKMILTSMMSEANLFEFTPKENPNTKEAIETLNNLLSNYANVKIGKLRPLDNSIDIRVESLSTRKTYSFDGLSSGQKEIISTLFMIWSNTRNNPAVVLIDEPELHLNVEWHRNFIKKLIELAPQNQYIIATHSEDIMASVDKTRRILLTE